MLVNASDMLKNAEAGHYALGAFNTNNLEWTLAILQAAEEAKSPLIMQCTGGAAKWMGSYKVCADMVKACVEALDITVPVALHLDHGSYEDCFKAMDAGFTSIMYDGSHEADFQTNLDRTKELVDLAHSRGLSIEAEVGGIGGTEDGVTSSGELADPEQCKQIADLGVDFRPSGCLCQGHSRVCRGWQGSAGQGLRSAQAHQAGSRGYRCSHQGAHGAVWQREQGLKPLFAWPRFRFSTCGEAKPGLFASQCSAQGKKFARTLWASFNMV